MFTTEQAAGRLGVTPRTVVKHIGRGRIVAHKHGRDYVITEEALKNFEQNRRGPGWVKGISRKKQ